MSKHWLLSTYLHEKAFGNALQFMKREGSHMRKRSPISRYNRLINKVLNVLLHTDTNIVIDHNFDI